MNGFRIRIDIRIMIRNGIRIRTRGDERLTRESELRR